MLNTLENRENFVNELYKHLSKKFDLSSSQIFIFGSFLTDEYIDGKSDIDIGVYSTNETTMYDIRCELDVYLSERDIPHDIVLMHLNDKLKINIPIMVYGKMLTSYKGNELLDYLVSMIKQYGFEGGIA